MLKKYYLGGFFWAPIPVKRYQNTSGFAGERTITYREKSFDYSFFPVEILAENISTMVTQSLR